MPANFEFRSKLAIGLLAFAVLLLVRAGTLDYRWVKSGCEEPR
jgi:hypothetical protein